MKKIINKKVKGLDKLYQASIDRGDSSIFHSKCDDVSNTLTIICSPMEEDLEDLLQNLGLHLENLKMTENHFYFHLIKKIYSYKCNGKAIYCHKDFGPNFATVYTIKIDWNAIGKKNYIHLNFIQMVVVTILMGI